MSITKTPSPSDPSFLEAFAAAWVAPTDDILGYFAEGADYASLATGHDMKASELRTALLDPWLTFAPDLELEFVSQAVTADRRLTAEWVMRGTATGEIQLFGRRLRGAGGRFDVPGISFAQLDDHGKFSWFKDYCDLSPLQGIVTPLA